MFGNIDQIGITGKHPDNRPWKNLTDQKSQSGHGNGT